jgi:hypothetical protein
MKNKRIVQGLTLAASIIPLALMSGISAFAQSIQFTASVPSAPARMQVYNLATTPPPTDFINEKLAAVRLPSLQNENGALITRGSIGQTDQDKVRAFVNPTSGDAHFTPNLSELMAGTANTIPLAQSRGIAQGALADTRFIPKDSTQLKLGDSIQVMGQASGEAARTVMTIHPAVRLASGCPVYGKGSHALITTSNDGSIHGASRKWKTASAGSFISPRITSDQVKADIQRQLKPFVSAPGSAATVDKIELSYYDGNGNFLQPCYHFEATVTTGNNKSSPIRTGGYVAIGNTLEPIPDLTTRPNSQDPEMPREAEYAQPRMQTAGMISSGSNITLGEYINQDYPNNSAYISMASAFLTGMNYYNSLAAGSTPTCTRTQYYVAQPWEVNGSNSKNYLNAVNVAYTEPHGAWWLNTTLSNYGDVWYVNQIGTGGNPGFGAAAGGKLATWIIMSCEVVPSAYDCQNAASGATNAFAPWFPVFQGLHNVVGFRTIMFYPDDNLQTTFGEALSRGGDVTSAWFQSIASCEAGIGTYANTLLKGSPMCHYDRGSTFVDSRDVGQSIYSIQAQTKATSLTNFWMNN